MLLLPTSSLMYRTAEFESVVDLLIDALDEQEEFVGNDHE